MIVGFLSILLRFFYWQVLKAKELTILVAPQHERKSVETAYRGKILASDGSILVGSADSWNLFAEPYKIKNPDVVAEKLAPLLITDKYDSKALSEEKNTLNTILTGQDKYWIPIKSRLNNSEKEEISNLNYNFLGFDKVEVRKYPESSVSAHLLGFLGKNQDGDNQGYFGLEGYYDNILSSSPGMQKGETDIKGIPILIGKSKKVPSFSGVDLVTYIDKGVQLIADEELKKGIEKYGALNGSVIIMDPVSGGILAMSSYPSFDPERYWEYSNELFLNPVISSSFEPGSVFKIIIMASAIDMSAVEPDTKCDICSGPVHIDKYDIQTWNNKYYPNSTMTDVIVHSDNVGMTFVAKNIGIDRIYEYLKKFGFGEKTGIDLQGESNSPLRKKEEWSDVDLYTSSFGQGIAVTPIQMIAAANVIANDGMYVKPAVVKNASIDTTNYDFRKNEDTRRVISQKAATEMKMMMVEAAKNGESKWTYKRGYGVAGKTGTAQIPISGHYDAEKTIASFIGFAPYNNPKFIMLLTLREPKTSPWASETAAPVWYRIAERLFVHFGIIPEK